MINGIGRAAGIASVTGIAPVLSSGGTTPAISIPAATASVNGYATSTQITKLDGIETGAINNLIAVKEKNTSAIYKGQACYVSGSSGSNIQVGLYDPTNSAKIRLLGVASDNIVQNTDGFVVFNKLLTNVDTRATNTAVNPNAETWAPGDLLWAAITAGGLTNVRPTSGRSSKVARTVKGNSNTDILVVMPFENPVWQTGAVGESIILRAGDSVGATSISIRNYVDSVVATINSHGKLGLTTSDPQEKLHVSAGNILLSNNYGYTGYRVDGLTKVNLVLLDNSDNLNITTPASQTINLKNGTTTVGSVDANGYLGNQSFDSGVADLGKSGELTTFAAVNGEADSLTAGQIVYLYNSAGALQWKRIDADAEATSSGLLGVVLSTITTGSACANKIMLRGIYRNDTLFALTPAAKQFLSATAGALTETAPSSSGQVVRIVGYAISADILYFTPDNTWVLLT